VTWRSWLAFAALGVIWGLPYFFIKLALTGISPAAVAWSRLALAALVLLPIAWKQGSLRSVMAHKKAILAFALAEMVGPFFLISLGESWISSSLAGILTATVPVTIILIAPLFGAHEPLGWRRVSGLVIGFLGVVVLLGIGSVHGLLAWAGVACVLLATLGYAVGAMIVQKHLNGVDGLGAVAVSLGVASIVLLPPAILTAPSHLPPLVALLSVGVLGIVCTALAMMLYFYLITRAGAARASIITYINPAVAALLGALVLHESFGPGSAAGLALILLGSWMSTTRTGARLKSELGATGGA
jgi:drug/metabolite transporter (DMT)-like permease